MPRGQWPAVPRLGRIRHVRARDAVGISGLTGGFRRTRRPGRRDRPPGWCGGPRSPSNSGCATRCWRSYPGSSVIAADRPADPVDRRRGTARRATSTGRRRPSSRSRTATSARTRPYAQIAQRYAARFRLRCNSFGEDRGGPAHQRVRTSRRGVPRQADHRRRRAEQPDDRRSHPHAGDRDAGPGRCRRARRQRGRGAPGPPPTGVGHGIRRAHRLQDSHIRRRSDDDADIPRRRESVRDGRAHPVCRRRRLDVRLLHHHGADDAGGRRILRQRRRHDMGQPSTTSPSPATSRSTPPAGSCRSGRRAWPAACITSSTLRAR